MSEWQPTKTAPAKTRVLVADDKGRVAIARRVPVRWYDDADAMIDPPAWWMPLPGAPAAPPEPPPKPRRRKTS
jgi:hypothetical protein